jgi:hypothetical protein
MCESNYNLLAKSKYGNTLKTLGLLIIRHKNINIDERFFLWLLNSLCYSYNVMLCYVYYIVCFVSGIACIYFISYFSLTEI